MAEIIVIPNGSGGATVVPPSNILWVAIGGNDGTGQRGNQALPFATIDGALAAMQDGDCIRVGPGTFAGPTAPIPAALASGSVVGTGPGVTFVQNAAGGWVFSNAPRLSWIFLNLVLQGAPGNVIVDADGTTQGGVSTFFPNGISFGNVVIPQGNLNIVLCGSVTFTQCALGFDPGSSHIFGTCGSAIMNRCTMTGGSIFSEYNADDPLGPGPAANTQNILAIDTNLIDTSVFLVSQGCLTGTKGSTVGTINGQVMSMSLTGPGTAPRVVWPGQVGTVDFGSGGLRELPDGPLQVILDFNGADILGPSTYRVAAPAANRQTVNANAYHGGNVLVNDGVTWRGRGATFASPINTGFLSTSLGSTGTVVPPSFAMGPVANAGGPTTITYPFTLDDTDYAVAVDLDAIIGAVDIATTARTVTDCTVTVTGSGGNLRVIIAPYAP